MFDSVELGKFVALDGEIVFSEKDEFIYDEMVTHVPMAVHPNVRNVLIIGGGDGGVARELLQYPTIETIDVVETDQMFVDVCRQIFPEVASSLDDPRVRFFCDDGLRFLRGKRDQYDLIINDSTDPFGHTEGLFTKEFYGSCYKALRDDGIMAVSYTHLDEMNRISRENLTGIRVIRAFNNDSYEQKRFQASNDGYAGYSKKVFRLMMLTQPVFFFLMNLAILVIFWIAGNLIQDVYKRQGLSGQRRIDMFEAICYIFVYGRF